MGFFAWLLRAMGQREQPLPRQPAAELAPPSAPDLPEPGVGSPGGPPKAGGREIKKVIVHCSDGEWGDAAFIDKIHREERGWKDGIGYHYVITNGRLTYVGGYQEQADGVVEVGRPEEKAGAHARPHNADSIGVCLIGRHHFTAKQLLVALPKLLEEIMQRHGLSASDIYGHRDFSGKTCPNFEVGWLATKKE